MNCKFCNGELEEGNLVCPHCQKDNAQQMPVPEEETPVIAEETAENPQQEETTPPKKKTWVKVTAIVCCAAIVLGLAVGIWCWINGGFLPKENDIYVKSSYAKSDKKVIKAADQVVARVGDKELTNGQLQVQYWNQISQFLNTYSYYVAGFGLDTTIPLSQQMVDDLNVTWEQFFLETALTAWHENQCLVLAAEEEGYQITEETQAYLDGMAKAFVEVAASYGFTDAQEFVNKIMDPTCTLDEYLAGMELDCIAADYLVTMVETPTRDEVEAHFDAYAEAFATNYGITKDTGKLIDVRHILIIPEGGTTNEDGETVYSEEEWDACLVKARKLLNEWKNGEATEESFAQMAYQYSEDNYEDGGLYEYVYEGQMVEEFEDWCFDSSREPGDTGLVRTVFGYHIMYYVYGEEGWYRYGQQSLAQDMSRELIDSLVQKYPMEVDYRKIAVVDALISG